LISFKGSPATNKELSFAPKRRYEAYLMNYYHKILNQNVYLSKQV